MRPHSSAAPEAHALLAGTASATQLNAFLKSPVVSITGIDVAKPPEMLLSEFLKMYTLYCYNLELEPLERKKDIVRQVPARCS